MRVAIVGSRAYPDPVEVALYVMALPPDTVIISGGANGPDAWAAWTAWAIGLPEPVVYKARWTQRRGKGQVVYAPKAGFKRNWKIVEDAERVVAFWDGRSNGTWHTITIAGKMGRPVETHLPTDVRTVARGGTSLPSTGSGKDPAGSASAVGGNDMGSGS